MKKSPQVFLTLLAASLSFWSCQHSDTISTADQLRSPREVKTVTVHSVNHAKTVFAAGRLSSTEEATLSFKTGGIIKGIYVREGQRVRRGQLLAELDLDEIRAQTEQAQLGEQKSAIDIENAELAVRLAARDLKNVQGLYRDSVATLVQLENAEIALDNARNQLEAARTGRGVSQQQLNVARFNLRYSKIVAPADGIILRKLADPNELVGPGAPVLLFGSSEQAQVIKVNITDKDIIQVQLNNAAAVQFDAYPGEVFPGSVRQIASMADPATGTYEVEIEVDPDGKRLLNGFIGSVHIHTQQIRRLLQVPVDALYSADQKTGRIFRVKDSIAELTTVGIAAFQNGHLLVEEGLAAGDEVVVSGVGYLEDRQRVRVVADTGMSYTPKPH